MKWGIRKSRFVLPVFILLVPFFSFSQKLTGIWKGYFITEGGSHYTLEFQVKQNKDGSVVGVSYSYGSDVKFYGKATMTGNYALADKVFSIQETRTVEVKTDGGTCLMNYRFTYSKSGKEEFLEGTYVGKMEDRNDPRKNGVWGDCGGGKVYLRRVAQSDFYPEPFLKNEKPKDTVKKSTTTPAPQTPSRTTTPPPKKPATTTSTKTTTTKKPSTTQNTTTVKTTTPAKPKTDTSRKVNNELIVMEPTEEKPRIMVPPTTRARKNELTQTVNVTNGTVSIRLYDNGEVDNDTISVYLDGKPLLSNKRLSTIPITITLDMSEDNPEHVLVMVAENLGRIPPNTSLMIVQDGDKRYQVSITSTEQKNAMVRFRYQKK